MILDKLHPILRKYRAPDPGDDGGGNADDRGDDWTPTDDDAPEKKDDTGADGDADKGGDKDGKDKKTAAKAKTDADDDGDDDGEEDDAAGKDKDGKDKPARKDNRIPVSRHKEILQKEREAREEVERKLKQYEGGNRIAATNDKITALETKILEADKAYTKLLTDGDHEKAAEKRREMRALENEVIELKSDLKANIASANAVEKMRYDTTVERLEAAYPVLNPEHDDHDPDATQDVLDLATTYRTRRSMTPAQAIQKAAEKLLGVATKKQEAATTVQARVDKTEAEELAEKERKEAERKRKQVEKNLDANGKQPPDTTKRGADSDRAGGGINPKDVLKMSQDDFNKLDDATLARLRGDVVA